MHGAQGTFLSGSTANFRIPRTLAGRGDVDVVLKADGKASNVVTINVN